MAFQLLEMALQRANAGRVVGAVRRREELVSGFDTAIRWLMQHEGDGAQIFQTRLRVDRDGLSRLHAVLRCFYGFAVHFDPTAFDVLFGLGARTCHLVRDLFRQALSETFFGWIHTVFPWVS